MGRGEGTYIRAGRLKTGCIFWFTGKWTYKLGGGGGGAGEAFEVNFFLNAKEHFGYITE